MAEANVFQEIDKSAAYGKAAKEKTQRFKKSREFVKKKYTETKKFLKEKAQEVRKSEIEAARIMKKKAKATAVNTLKAVGKGFKPKTAAGLKQSYRQGSAPAEIKVVQQINQPVPYHVEMKAPRDNGFRPHEPRSLVKEPDIEGYQRNLLLQPARNIWEEPRKANVWDETFGNMKKKSIFESKK